MTYLFRDLPVGATFRIAQTSSKPSYLYQKTEVQRVGFDHQANTLLIGPKEYFPLTPLPVANGIHPDDELVHPTVTCFDCSLACLFSGYPGDRENPPEEPYTECQVEEATELYEQWGDLSAAVCPHFSPMMAETCWQCKACIDKPAHEWHLWVSTPYDHHPVCSEACKAAGQAAIDEQVRKEMEDDWPL